METMQYQPIPQAQTSKELIYNGTPIQEKGKQLSLTDMWKAAGETENKDPRQWLRSSEAKNFIEFLSTSLNVGNSHIIKTIKGKGGGTWAHWQIALAYAKYLSPEFHIWCNQIVRNHMEGRASAKTTSLTEYDKSIIGNMVKNCTGLVIRQELENLIPALIKPMVKAGLLERNLLVRHGRTAGEIWRAHRLPRLKNAAVWLGNRLQEMGALLRAMAALNAGLIPSDFLTLTRLKSVSKTACCTRPKFTLMSASAKANCALSPLSPPEKDNAKYENC